jgi:hypothetical protein
MADITRLIIEFAVRTTVLTALLCGMVKIQKLNFFFPGLLVSAVIACVVDALPHFGHFLAVPALFLCVWKVTGARPLPDVTIAVLIPYLLMFGVNVLLFTGRTGAVPPAVTIKAIVKTNLPPAVVKPLTPALIPPPSTNLAVTNVPVNPAKTNLHSADEILKDFAVKGVTRNGDKSMLVIHVNKRTYTIEMGEPALVQTTSGPCQIRLVNLGESWATVQVNGEAAYLRVH